MPSGSGPWRNLKVEIALNDVHLELPFGRGQKYTLINFQLEIHAHSVIPKHTRPKGGDLLYSGAKKLPECAGNTRFLPSARRTVKQHVRKVARRGLDYRRVRAFQTRCVDATNERF